tara:strand:+ start:399 stop:725 length:327 start_codon:yes stop_codon:yes gene_type:complete
LNPEKLSVGFLAVHLRVVQIVMLYEKLLTGPVDEVAVVVRRKLRYVRVLGQTVRTVYESHLDEVVRILARIKANTLVVTTVIWKASRVGQVINSNIQVIDKNNTFSNV